MLKRVNFHWWRGQMQRTYSTRSEVRLWLVLGVCGRNLFSQITGENSSQMKNKSHEKKVISSFLVTDWLL